MNTLGTVVEPFEREFTQREAAFTATFSANDFAAMVDAHQRLESARACFTHLQTRHSGLDSALIEREGVRDLTLAALAETRAEMSNQIEALALEEARRFREAGLEHVGENPALVKLRAHLKNLEELFNDASNRRTTDDFRGYLPNYLAALKLS